MAERSRARRGSRRGSTRSRRARTSRSSTRGRRRRSPLRRVLRGLLILILVMVMAIVAAGAVFYHRTELPDPNKGFSSNTSFIYYNDSASKIGSFSVQNRQSITYDEMPQNLRDAVVSAENRTFWSAPGISVKGMSRAAFSVLRGGDVQGGSTITQQYIKVLYLSQERTMQRKLKELVLADKMGRKVPKEDILAGYLNTIYFGRGAYGVQAAAKAYFNIDAKDLDLRQAAVLAAVLNNPTLFDPSDGPAARERLLGRYRYVLDGMLEMGRISQNDHDAASHALPDFPDVPVNNRWQGTKGYLLKLVQDELVAQGFTESQIAGGGLKVTTTLDPKVQQAAVDAGQRYKRIAGNNAGDDGPARLHPAIASVDARTGGVLGIYGGDDYVRNSRNWATTARPGASSIKTYAVIAALRNGFSLQSALEGNTFTPKGDSKPVRNEFHHEYGTVSLQTATEKSINTAFVDVVSRMRNGPAQVIKAANDAGVPKGDGWDLNNRIALGTAEVSPLDQAAGYATLANDGVRMPTHFVAKVVGPQGNTLYENKTKGAQAIEPDIARDTTHALRSVVEQGTGAAVSRLGYQVAGKTGTNGVGDKITSAWFVAYTKQISTAVMFVAGDGGTDDLDPFHAPDNPTFFGGTYPARTWAAVMDVAMKGKEHERFAGRQGVNLWGKHHGEDIDDHIVPATPHPRSTAGTTTPTPRKHENGQHESTPPTHSPIASPTVQPTRTPAPDTPVRPSRPSRPSARPRPNRPTTRPIRPTHQPVRPTPRPVGPTTQPHEVGPDDLKEG